MGSLTENPWRNWAGNQQASPRRVVTPHSTEETAAAVTAAADAGQTVRMIGSGHSFSAAAVAEGTLLRPQGLTALRSVDTATGLVTVEAGMQLKTFNDELARHGLALANMGVIAEQTLAGASQTGTHGSGRDTASLCSQIAALELVTADGETVNCSREENPDLFDAARVGVGSLGIVTAITWQTVPAFVLEVEETPMPWAEVLDGLDDLRAANEHFEFWWFPYTDNCIVKRRNRTDGPARPPSRFQHWFVEVFQENTMFSMFQRVGSRWPSRHKPIAQFIGNSLGARSFSARSDKGFTGVFDVPFIELEYAVPSEALPALLPELKALIDGNDWLMSFPVEVRFSPPEDSWLAGAHGRDTAWIALHIYNRNPHQECFDAVEALMWAAGGRPHWGKYHTKTAADLADRYPRFGDFTALRDKTDPDRRFANAYASQIFGD